MGTKNIKNVVGNRFSNRTDEFVNVFCHLCATRDYLYYYFMLCNILYLTNEKISLY
jgi:hypothetical protein